MSRVMTNGIPMTTACKISSLRDQHYTISIALSGESKIRYGTVSSIRFYNDNILLNMANVDQLCMTARDLYATYIVFYE